MPIQQPVDYRGPLINVRHAPTGQNPCTTPSSSPQHRRAAESPVNPRGCGLPWCWSYLVPAPSGCVTPAAFTVQSREDQRVLNPMHQLPHHRRPFLDRAGWPRACGGSEHLDSDLQSVSSLFAAFAIGKLIARAVCVGTAESHLMRNQRFLEGTGSHLLFRSVVTVGRAGV